jgi:hypothetical protein
VDALDLVKPTANSLSQARLGIGIPNAEEVLAKLCPVAIATKKVAR